MDTCRQYHHQQAEMDTEIDALAKDLEQLKQNPNISAREKTERLKVGPLHFLILLYFVLVRTSMNSRITKNLEIALSTAPSAFSVTF